jgi:hypothetical protein
MNAQSDSIRPYPSPGHKFSRISRWQTEQLVNPTWAPKIQPSPSQSKPVQHAFFITHDGPAQKQTSEGPWMSLRQELRSLAAIAFRCSNCCCRWCRSRSCQNCRSCLSCPPRSCRNCWCLSLNGGCCSCWSESKTNRTDPWKDWSDTFRCLKPTRWCRLWCRSRRRPCRPCYYNRSTTRRTLKTLMISS